MFFLWEHDRLRNSVDLSSGQLFLDPFKMADQSLTCLVSTLDQGSSQGCKDALLPLPSTRFPFEISQFVLRKLQSDTMRGPLDLAPETGNDVIQRLQAVCINFGFLHIRQFTGDIQCRVG